MFLFITKLRTFVFPALVGVCNFVMLKYQSLAGYNYLKTKYTQEQQQINTESGSM